MNRTVVITLGRSIKGKPMPLKRWRGFQEDVFQVLNSAGAEIIQQPAWDMKRSADQLGYWDGVAEPACTFVAFLRSGVERRNQLASDLKCIAREYEQDAIGYINILGQDHVVTP